MTHPRLRSFFTGAVDELRAAYAKSEGAPSACKGSLRERGVHRAVAHSLPSIARVYEGEIIDSRGGQSGQLDGIVVHATGSALATAPDDSRIVLAEGVVAVLESKSSIDDQWDQVRGTWDKVKGLRRPLTGRVLLDPTALMSEKALPFTVIGKKGWARSETIREKALELFTEFGEGHAPRIQLIQLDPPGIAESFWAASAPRTLGGILPEEERWRTLASVWFRLVEASNRVVAVSIDSAEYLRT